ncbi:hypothetical protein OOT46_19530 [Aquabacterium sp. A7-Y]|uniref:hypothetical protein n=1 Tax=Aquabacterium sp. A7-Y TaxID=1349605 RepID=UPI00223DC70C|nr:hypothetical protein [Aquabacterium sp. A7-Y]MCW7540032.1 hypothetical protein [Aquabacterium sp. A7-Y]
MKTMWKKTGPKQAALLAAALALLAGCDSRTATEKGQDLAKEKLDFVQGIGNVVKGQGKDLGGTVGEGVGNVVTGLGKGFDASLQAKPVRLADPEAAKAVQVTRAQELPAAADGKSKGMTVYIVSENGYEGSLRLLAMSGGAEVGRSTAKAKIDKGDAKYVDFSFDERVPLTSVDQYSLVLVK